MGETNWKTIIDGYITTAGAVHMWRLCSPDVALWPKIAYCAGAGLISYAIGSYMTSKLQAQTKDAALEDVHSHLETQKNRCACNATSPSL